MNYLKVKKTLIEWERELDIWIPDIQFDEHFMNCSKIEAFDKINVYNVINGWNDNIISIYKKFKYEYNSDFYLFSIGESDLIKRKLYFGVKDLYCEKPLIEFEKELGIWIVDIIEEDHYKIHLKKDVLDKLDIVYKTKKWDIEANMYYSKYLLKSKGENDENNESLKNEDLVLSEVKNEKHHIHKKKNASNFLNIIKVNKSKKKNNLKKSIIKKTMSLVLSMVTIASGYAFSKVIQRNDDSFTSEAISYSKSTEDINNFKMNNFESAILSKQNDKIDKDVDNKTEKKVDIEKKDQIIKTDLDNEKSFQEIKTDIDDENVSVHIGDDIELTNDALIYGNYYDTSDRKYGLNPYYGNEMDRYISAVTLEYNGVTDYYDNQSKIDSLINMGAKVIALQSSNEFGVEGYYNICDVKVKSKRI